MTTKTFAPAKVNLTLHITGLRSDGFHSLDSLVVFAGFGDCISVEPAAKQTLSIDGPFADAVPADENNLVLQAARLFEDSNAAIRLTKNLPVASGIGGGSSDAAATLRALSELTGQPIPAPEKILSLGSDVPVCMSATPVRMQGIGEILSPVTLPEIYMVLINPCSPMPTGKVFSVLDVKENPPMPSKLPDWKDARDLFDWLNHQRNDLEAAAVSINPEVRSVLKAISGTIGCRLSRMSGSGATCFGLYENMEHAKHAADNIKERHTEWWVKSASLWR